MHGKYNGAITAFKDTAPDRYMPPNAGVDQYKVCWAEGRAGVLSTCSGPSFSRRCGVLRVVRVW